jgi:hypothetical protein
MKEAPRVRLDGTGPPQNLEAPDGATGRRRVRVFCTPGQDHAAIDRRRVKIRVRDRKRIAGRNSLCYLLNADRGVFIFRYPWI